MNQTTTATDTDTHPVSDLEALRLQLEENGRVYCNNRNQEEAHERLLHTLQRNDCREIISAVADEDDLANTFIQAGYRNDNDVLEAFLNRGMNIDIVNQAGCTALMYASGSGREECVRFLLDHNANVDIQHKIGYTALMIASQYGETKTVEMLLEKNANPDIQDNSGMTALMYVRMRRSKKIVQMLLNHGANVELTNKDGKTVLDFAEDEDIKELLRNHVTTSYVLK